MEQTGKKESNLKANLKNFAWSALTIFIAVAAVKIAFEGLPKWAIKTPKVDKVGG